MISLSWRAIRGRFLPVSLLSSLLGAAAAHHQWGAPLWPLVLPVMGGAFFVHAGSNLWNDYADEMNGADRANVSPTRFNGGSRVIQERTLSASSVRSAAWIMFMLALLTGLVLVPHGGWGVPLLTLAGIGFGLGYSSRPIWLSGRGLGELAVGVSFGPLLAGGSALALTGRLSITAFLASVPLGLLVSAILVLNEIPDLQADSSVGKRTLAVRWGELPAVFAFRGLVTAALVVLIVLIACRVLPVRCAIALAPAPLAVWVCRRARRVGGLSATASYIRVAAGTALLHLTAGILLVLSLWL